MRCIVLFLGLQLCLTCLSANGRLETDTIPEDLLFNCGIQVYDASKYNAINQEGARYSHPTQWPQGVTIMSRAFQELYEQDHGERVLSYPELELFDLLQMADMGDLEPKVKNQLTGFLFEYFSGRVGRGESYNTKNIDTGDGILNQRILVFAAWSRRSAELTLEFLDAMLDSGRGNLAAHSLKGDMEYALKQWDAAAGWFTRAIELSPKYSYAYLLRGASYAEMGKTEEAEADLKKSIDLYPENLEAYTRLGFLYQELERFEKAVGCFKKVLDKDPSRYVVCGATGFCLERLEQYDSALCYYEKLLELHPEDLHAYVSMGDIYHKKGEYSVAVYIFSKALDQNPEYARALSSRGNSYFRQENYEKAIADFENTLAIDSADIYAALRLADCYYWNKRYTEGIPLYESVLKIDPDNYDALHMLGYIYSDLGENSKAIEALEKSLAIKPDHAPSLTNLGWTWYLEGDFEKCLEYSEEAYSIDSKEVIPRFNAALSLLRLGSVEESYSLYMETLQNFPHADIEGAVADLNDLVEKKIRKKEAKYILKKIFKTELHV